MSNTKKKKEETIRDKGREEKREQKSREEKKRKDKKKKKKKQKKKEKKKKRACILQKFYIKNMFKNTLNFKLTLWLYYMVFLKKIVVLTVQRTFF